MTFKYKFMLFIAAILSCMSSIMTALGMTNLFSAAGMFILSLFVIIDLGRFILFNFTVNEWSNLRAVKYFICIILALLFCYSGAGIYAKLDSLIAPSTRQAMIDMAKYLKESDNATIKQNRSEDLAKIAQDEYKSAMDWNRMDYENCIARANKNKWAENKCNNTKRSLDNKASIALKEALAKADINLQETVDITEKTSKNQSEVASILSTICKFTQTSCDSYDKLQNSLTILILLVIVGTDLLQIAIVLAVHTRKDKNIIIYNKKEKLSPEVKKQPNMLIPEKREFLAPKFKEKCEFLTPQLKEKCVLDILKQESKTKQEINKKLPVIDTEIKENIPVENTEKLEEKITSKSEEKVTKNKEFVKRKIISPINFIHKTGNIAPKPKK